MKNSAINALIISMDTRLERILQSNESEQDQLNIRLHSNLTNFKFLPKSDAYIFDVELTSDNPISTVTKIYKLKKEIGDNPLILIGKKEVIDKVQHNEMIHGMVARTINKPISYSQIQLAVNSSLSKSLPPIEPVELKENSNHRRYVVASLLAAFILISAFTYFQTNETPLSQSENIVNQNSSLPDSINPDHNTQPIDKLNQAALLAVNEGRLSEPENNNAIYFLKQIKQLDPYNNTANQTHRNLFQLLEASYLDHASKNNYSGTRTALQTILDYEPYNHKYAVLLRQLDERDYLAKQNKPDTDIESAAIESTKSIESIIEDNIETDNDKSVQSSNTNSIVISNYEIEIDQTTENNTSNVVERTPDIAPTPREEPETVVASIDKSTNVIPKATITNAEIIKRVEPYYPRMASELNYEGWIELEYRVDTNGLATNIKVLDGQKIKTFENAAIKALKKWRFSPAIDSANNTPKLSEPMTANFNFKLN